MSVLFPNNFSVEWQLRITHIQWAMVVGVTCASSGTKGID